MARLNGEKTQYYWQSGTKAVIKKVSIEGASIPININNLINCFTPNLNLCPTSDAKIMEWVKQQPKINTEYFKSETMEDIEDYENRYDLQHKFHIIHHGRRKAVIKIDMQFIFILFQRGRTVMLEFSNKFDARKYWLALQPSKDITGKEKEYLKEIGQTRFVSL